MKEDSDPEKILSPKAVLELIELWRPDEPPIAQEIPESSSRSSSCPS